MFLRDRYYSYSIQRIDVISYKPKKRYLPRTHNDSTGIDSRIQTRIQIFSTNESSKDETWFGHCSSIGFSQSVGLRRVVKNETEITDAQVNLYDDFYIRSLHCGNVRDACNRRTIVHRLYSLARDRMKVKRQNPVPCIVTV